MEDKLMVQKRIDFYAPSDYLSGTFSEIRRKLAELEEEFTTTGYHSLRFEHDWDDEGGSFDLIGTRLETDDEYNYRTLHAAWKARTEAEAAKHQQEHERKVLAELANKYGMKVVAK